MLNVFVYFSYRFSLLLLYSIRWPTEKRKSSKMVHTIKLPDIVNTTPFMTVFPYNFHVREITIVMDKQNDSKSPRLIK